MKQELIDNFCVDIIEKIRNEFKTKESLEPAFYLGFEKNGNIEIEPTPSIEPFLMNDKTKEILSSLLKATIVATEPDITCMATEVWYLERDRKKVDEKNLPKPSESDDKVEGIMLAFETKDSEFVQVWKILREENKPPTLEKSSIIIKWRLKESPGKSYTGKFSNLFDLSSKQEA